MEIQINGVIWTFFESTVQGEPVLAARWRDQEDGDTVWTKDQTTLPLLPEQAGEWLDTLHWEVGRAGELG